MGRAFDERAPRGTLSSVLRRAGCVLVLSAAFAWTWAWFGPVGGFHHMVRLGLLGWGIVDGEDGTTVLRWSPLAVVASAAVWMAGLGAIAWLAHTVRSTRRRDRLVPR